MNVYRVAPPWCRRAVVERYENHAQDLAAWKRRRQEAVDFGIVFRESIPLPPTPRPINIQE